MTKRKQQFDVAPPPPVAPPPSYKTPSLPTLAAIGVISAAALMTGCNRFKSNICGEINETTDYTVEESKALQELKSLGSDGREKITPIPVPGEPPPFISPTPEKPVPQEKVQDTNVPFVGLISFGD